MNRAAYDAVAEAWSAARSGFYGCEQAFLDLLLEGLAPGSLILDAGCGPGRPMAEYLVGRGMRVRGVDQSVEMLRLARRNLPGQELVLCALERYAFPGGYQGALCWDALFHIERGQHRPILERMARGLSPGGRLLLTSGGSAHAPFTDSMFDREFFYDSHPPEVLLRLLEELGLEVLAAEFLNPPTDGRDKGRLAVAARRPA